MNVVFLVVLAVHSVQRTSAAISRAGNANSSRHSNTGRRVGHVLGRLRHT